MLLDKPHTCAKPCNVETLGKDDPKLPYSRSMLAYFRQQAGVAMRATALSVSVAVRSGTTPILLLDPTEDPADFRRSGDFGELGEGGGIKDPISPTKFVFFSRPSFFEAPVSGSESS